MRMLAYRSRGQVELMAGVAIKLRVLGAMGVIRAGVR